MYIPEIYKNKNIQDVKDFIKQNGFSVVINQDNSKLLATHIPLMLSQANNKDVLIGHLSKENPQGLSFKDNQEVLVIFNGPHSYISSSWYDHENVPTWNYIAVHVYGTVRIVSEEELLESLKNLVDKYEKNSKNPVSVDNLSKNTMRQINGIIGIEITINQIDAASKLSQNKDQKNHQNIIKELENNKDSNSIEIANAMKKNTPK